MPYRAFLEAARVEKSDVDASRPSAIAFPGRARVSKHYTSMMSRFFRRIGVTVKKRPLSHASRIARMPQVATANDGETYQGAHIDPRRLVFIDETWTKTNILARRGGATPRGERLVDKEPQGKWRRPRLSTPPCATTRHRRALHLFDGPIDGERFHAYVEQFLVPTLKPGDVVILDNLGSHKGRAVRTAIRDAGARLVFPRRRPSLRLYGPPGARLAAPIGADLSKSVAGRR